MHTFLFTIAAIYLFAVDKKLDEIHEIKTELKGKKLAWKSLW